MARLERVRDGAGILRGDPQERARRPLGLTPSLLPVLQRRDAHPDHPRELRLRLIESHPDRPDVLRRQMRAAPGLPLRTAPAPRCPHTRHATDPVSTAPGAYATGVPTIARVIL